MAKAKCKCEATSHFSWAWVHFRRQTTTSRTDNKRERVVCVLQSTRARISFNLRAAAFWRSAFDPVTIKMYSAPRATHCNFFLWQCAPNSLLRESVALSLSALLSPPVLLYARRPPALTALKRLGTMGDGNPTFFRFQPAASDSSTFWYHSQRAHTFWYLLSASLHGYLYTYLLTNVCVCADSVCLHSHAGRRRGIVHPFKLTYHFSGIIITKAFLSANTRCWNTRAAAQLTKSLCRLTTHRLNKQLRRLLILKLILPLAMQREQ